jgi:hypothetical protein
MRLPNLPLIIHFYSFMVLHMYCYILASALNLSLPVTFSDLRGLS